MYKMGENTKIEWADHTFNPWVGCTKVSPACDHCYAESWAKRSGQVQWGQGAQRSRTTAANWQNPIKWNREAERLGVRQRVFCASLADVFDNEVPEQWRRDLFNLILSTPHLDWLLLTKRIGNAAKMIDAAAHPIAWPWPNVWIGATICNQEEADRDIPKLLKVPAAKRFLSIEPMLGAIDLRMTNGIVHGQDAADYKLDWVIVGGESGPQARPMHPDWARSIRDQCADEGVAFLFKQWGEWEIASTANGHHDSNMNTNKAHWVFVDGHTQKPSWIRSGLFREVNVYAMTKVGKNKAGRLLDGREWNGVPE
jgi:protein gp37